jgi:hypothetical protein
MKDREPKSLDLDGDGCGERAILGDDGSFHAVPARREVSARLGLIRGRGRGASGTEPLDSEDLEDA